MAGILWHVSENVAYIIVGTVSASDYIMEWFVYLWHILLKLSRFVAWIINCQCLWHVYGDLYMSR